MTSAPRPSSRRAMAAAIALATGVALAALRLDRPSVAVVEAPPCAGLPEHLAAWLVRLFDDRPVALIVSAMNAEALVFGVAALAWLVWTITQRVPVMATVAVAAAVTPALHRAPAPGHAMAFGVACVVLALLGPWGRSLPRAARLPLLIVSLGLLAAAVPVGCASGPLPSFAARVMAAIGGTAAGIGPAALAFAAFGVVALALDRRLSWLAPAAAIGALLFGVAGTGADTARSTAVMTAGVWTCVAVGMSAFLDRARHRAGHGLALVVVVLVPALQLARADRPTPRVALDAYGHDAMTHRHGVAILAALPPGANLVDEDALAAAMLRSVGSTKPATRVPATRSDVARALDAGVVYALPHGQRALQLQGFETTATGRIGAPGLARVSSDAGCARPDHEWQPWQHPAGATGVSLVATDPDAHGPIVMYLSAAALPDVRPHESSATAARGVFIWDYDLALPADRERLERDSRDDAIGAAWPVDVSRRMKRLEFWRTPGAPRVLALDVQGDFQAAVVRLSAAATGPAPLVCPTFVTPIEPLVPTRDGG